MLMMHRCMVVAAWTLCHVLVHVLVLRVLNSSGGHLQADALSPCGGTRDQREHGDQDHGMMEHGAHAGC